MLNLKKPALLFSLSVLATQVAWAENIKTLPPFPNDMTMLLDASDINADGKIDLSQNGIVNLKGDIETWYNKSTLNGGHKVTENNFFSDAIAADTGKFPKRLDSRLNGKATVSYQVDESRLMAKIFIKDLALRQVQQNKLLKMATIQNLFCLNLISNTRIIT